MSSSRRLPRRIPDIRRDFLNGERMVILDQIRTVDKNRLVKKIGEIGEPSREQILARLGEMFAK